MDFDIDTTDRVLRDRALFDRIASSYARKDLYEPSRIARRVRLWQTIGATAPGPDVDILEVGCGAGFAAQYLRGRVATYTGIDYSEELIRFAGELDLGPDVDFHPVDLHEWRPSHPYDVIFAIGVLHHMPDIPRALAAMKSMLKPGGHLVVNEPQPANVIFHWLRKLRSMVDASYSSGQEELQESELVSYFDHAGFEDIKTRAQGVLSTPFAEVTIRPHALAYPLSVLACQVDTWLEGHLQPVLRTVAWNIIITGRRAGGRRPEHVSPPGVD